jgi:hypothetical protein
MARVDERTSANMAVAPEEVFANVPHGGDHESRKHVAKKLIQSAKRGNVALDGLRAVARDALQQLSIGNYTFLPLSDGKPENFKRKAAQ